MASRTTAVAFLSAAVFAFAGCGDDDDDNASESYDTTTETTAASPEADAQAKGDARTLVTLVESCFVDSMDYATCDDETEGVAKVESATAAGFSVVAVSESGNEFKLTKKDSGALERTCTDAGEGGCPANGKW